MLRKLDAQAFGSRAVRERIYFLGLKCCSGGYKIPYDDCDGILQGMQMPAMPARKFINLADAPPPVTVASHEPREVAAGDGAAQAAEKRAAVYKDDHLELFAQHGLTWPPDLSEPCYAGLTRRAAEVLFFAHHVWPHRPCPENEDDAETTVEFLDVNNSLARLLGTKFTRGSGAEGELPSPWKSMAMTITGHSIICVRGWSGKTLVLRKAHAYEVMALAGWDWAWWRRGQQLDSESLGISLAGNAFSAFCVGPVVTAALVSRAGILQAIDAGEVIEDGSGDEDDERDLYDAPVD